MTFTVAIIGRPNVGKSTLFNRLTGKPGALVDDTPGVTRDRQLAKAHISDLEFELFDTAGLEDADDDSLEARMLQQTERAVDEADVIMMVIDGREGVTPLDKHFAKWLRKKNKPVVLVVNKAESEKARDGITESYSLGLGEPIPISASHGEGLADLYQALAPFALDEPEDDDGEEDEEDKVFQVAIVGRPNVGKSTLMNKILGEDRMLTGPEAGITRDAISEVTEYKGRKLTLVDTAGMRRKSNVTGKLEKMAVGDSLYAIKFAQVVIMMLDAQMPLEKQDLAIASMIEREGRGVVIALNKWDTIEDKKTTLEDIEHRLKHVLPQIQGVKLVPISAQRGNNIGGLLRACFETYDIWNKRVGTGELNRWLEAATSRHTPPLVKGRRLKLRYMTQSKSRPPTFALFVNKAGDLPDAYRRYLVNGLRESFGLEGVPIRITLRTSKNPYDPDTE